MSSTLIKDKRFVWHKFSTSDWKVHTLLAHPHRAFQSHYYIIKLKTHKAKHIIPQTSITQKKNSENSVTAIASENIIDILTEYEDGAPIYRCSQIRRHDTVANGKWCTSQGSENVRGTSLGAWTLNSRASLLPERFGKFIKKPCCLTKVFFLFLIVQFFRDIWRCQEEQKQNKKFASTNLAEREKTSSRQLCRETDKRKGNFKAIMSKNNSIIFCKAK